MASVNVHCPRCQSR
ncbi:MULTISPECIES: IS1 family transposase [Pectobacterium]|uniref:IS1 family transposase n=1 Tax=Pectobacterium parvum TaxID=2778550 RepID=A0AAP9IKE5_9GAMM|nr:hypothetical protein [Pectobacterium parvum]QHQ26770.1 hypothetical protein GMX10_19490 [Pectobacterium parvum]